jgi:hypothetical protein
MTPTGHAPTSKAQESLYTLSLHILRVLDEQTKAIASLQASVAAITALIGGVAPETITNVTFTVGPKP